jgi:hypothetical protein
MGLKDKIKSVREARRIAIQVAGIFGDGVLEILKDAMKEAWEEYADDHELTVAEIEEIVGHALLADAARRGEEVEL